MTHTTDPRGTNPMTDPADTRPVAVRLDDLLKLRSAAAGSGWNRVDHPDVNDAWHRITAVVEAAQELPPGIWGRVEFPGMRSHTGWITEGTRGGQSVLVVRDWNDCPLGEYILGPACRLVHLPTPLRRPDPLAALPPDATMALPAADAYEGYYPEADGEPADAFTGRSQRDELDLDDAGGPF